MIDVVDIIRRLQAEKEQAHKEPAHVHFTEINAELIKVAKEELNKEVRAGTLEFHKTLNGVSFNLKR